jgi:hypothetical protein
LKRKLGSAALLVAVLVVLFSLTALLLRLILLLLPGLLTRLAAVLTLLPRLLARLATILTLSGLTTLLTFFFHIVCHEKLLLIKHEPPRALRFMNCLKS